MMDQDLRDRLLADPDAILEDRDLMRALIAANERAMGSNIVDLRGIAMERLEDRLERLEDTHRTVIAAAYDNLAGTNQVHRAILQMLDHMTFETFLKSLSDQVSDTLRVDRVRLVLESLQGGDDPNLNRLGEVLCVAEPGFVATYLSGARATAPKPVTLRRAPKTAALVYGMTPKPVRSEALMPVDLGPGRLPGLLAMGSYDPHHFKPAHGTDLLSHFAGVFERTLRRWLA
jgi:hypothetical protein